MSHASSRLVGMNFLDQADPLLAGLNEQQRTAVVSQSKALLIVAGAGSGKTRVLTHRIAHLIRQRIAWPSQILAITFTNKAAAEMRQRVGQLLGEGAESMWVSTFHSACVRILRKEAERFGYVSGFTIYDSADSRALLKRLIKESGAEAYNFTPAAVGNKISRLKNELKTASDYAATARVTDPREAVFVELFSAYEQELRRANAFDFDDLIAQTVYLFRAFPDVAAKYRARFRWVLIDEYQDTNHAQYALVRELTKATPADAIAALKTPVNPALLTPAGDLPGAALTVVGDSDQSIYAFRGADIRNIVDFESDFSDAEVVKLEQNYRSTQNILDAANAIIAENFDRQEKSLWTASGPGNKIVGFAGYSQHDEARFVADEIEQLHNDGVAYGQIAVFYRTNAQTRALEELLMRAAIPYRVLGGTKFYDRAEIKDAIAYLTSIVNPYDPISWSRLLSAPKRGIGAVTEAQIAVFAETNEISYHEAMLRCAEINIGAKARNAVLSLAQTLKQATELAVPTAEGVKPRPVGEILETILKETRYIETLRAKRDPQDEARAENLEEIIAVAKEFDAANSGGTVIEFLTQVSLVAAVDELDDVSGTVSLMTLHTAKGLEFPYVFLTGVEEGLLPHQMSLNEPGGVAEERRLMYVGVTRAEKQLYITLASTRSQFGDIAATVPSRFLQDIPETLIDWRQTPDQVGHRGYAGGSLQTTGSQYGGGSGYGGSASGYGGGGYSGGQRRDAAAADRSQAAKWRERKQQLTASRAGGQPAKPFSFGTPIAQNYNDITLEVGDSIEHETYGVGSVRLITGSGNKSVAHVSFEEHGEKKLLIRLAPIIKITDKD